MLESEAVGASFDAAAIVAALPLTGSAPSVSVACSIIGPKPPAPAGSDALNMVRRTCGLGRVLAVNIRAVTVAVADVTLAQWFPDRNTYFCDSSFFIACTGSRI